MAETRRKFDHDFREGAVRLVRETGKPIAQVARDLGINAGTLGNWVNADKRRRGEVTACWVRMSGRSWPGCGGRTPSWRWSVMSSSAAWPSGSRTRWGGSGGRLDRRPEGSAPDPAGGELPGAGGVPVLVLQVEGRAARAAGSAAGPAQSRGRPPVRGARRQVRLAEDHRGPAGCGWRVSENTVAELMRELGLAARRKKKRRATTRPGRGRWRAPDLVKRDFPARQLNRKWFGDGTEIATDEGRLHLVSVLDVASRRVLGFTLGERHDAAAGLRRAGHGGGGARRPGARGGLPHRPGQ